jgi:hypothetical protein
MVAGVKPDTMKAKILASTAFLFACAAALAADKPAATQPILEKGMPGTAIQQLVGQPTEIQNLKSSDVKAEKWIYRRKLTEGTYQTANTEAYIPAMVGVQSTGMIVGKALVPDYRLKFVKVYQVTALLIVDGKLERGRQWTEREESFAD